VATKNVATIGTTFSELVICRRRRICAPGLHGGKLVVQYHIEQ
jgi:hypothetical protein